MVEAPKETTYRSLSPPKKPSSSPRELKKRKGVSFEDPVSPHPSTSDYLHSQNEEWSNLTFNLVDNNFCENYDGELYRLCEWLEVKQSELNEDSDENLPTEFFEQQGQSINYNALIRKPKSSLSSLRLKSLLRLDSRPRISTVSRLESIAETENASGAQEDLENAFKGVLPCSNSQSVNKRRSVERAVEMTANNIAVDNFWDEVEF